MNTRRIQILDAAAELLAEQGFAQTSVDALDPIERLNVFIDSVVARFVVAAS